MRSADPLLAGLGEQARLLQPRTVALRRALHRHPELGLTVPRTRDAVRGCSLRACSPSPASRGSAERIA